MEKQFNIEATREFVEKEFTEKALPSLMKYIEIPNLSPAFDPEWETNGTLDAAVNHIVKWIHEQDVKGLKLEVIKEPKRTPCIYIEIPTNAESDKTVLLYGHCDKQPPFEGWLEGLGATTPVIRGDKLYGRGGADDGYAAYAAILSIKALQVQNVPHARCVIFIESSEESMSPDLPYYVENMKERIGNPNLIICLDSGAGDYERLWMTTSLRGAIMCTLTVEVLTEGIHSGDASGIVPESFRIARILLDRLEDSKTGKVHESFFVEIPEDKLKHAHATVNVLKDEVHSKYPFIEDCKHIAESSDANLELYLNRNWRPFLCVTGALGLPDAKVAGNVMRPFTTLKLSLRLPPTLSAESAEKSLRGLLEPDAPYKAKVTVDNVFAAQGWNCPAFSDWLNTSTQSASEAFFGKKSESFGEGGSIPFMGMLHAKFPAAQFVVTGVLGPNSNAHGPNEFLHIPFTKKIICCVSHIIADHFNKS